MLKRLRLRLRECNPPNMQGDQLDTQKILGSSQGQLLLIQLESCTGRAAGVGLTSETSLHAQPEWKKAARARALVQHPGALKSLFSSVGKARTATDRKAVTLDSHLLPKLWFCFMEQGEKPEMSVKSRGKQNSIYRVTRSLRETKHWAEMPGQHKHIFTKWSWSESTPTLKEKHKEQMRFWKPTEGLLILSTIFLNTEAPEWFMFPLLCRLG